MKVVFMGTPAFAGVVLEKLVESNYEILGVVTQPDKPVGRKKILTPPPVKEVAMKHNIDVFQPVNIKEDYGQIEKWNPDIIITAAYGQIVPKAVLDIPKYKCINVHASLLPKYRGGAPIHKAIMNGDANTGVTIMYMVEKMDAGDIIIQKSIPIGKEDNVGTMFEKLAVLGADMLTEALVLIKSDNVNSIVQDLDKVTYASNISREEELINWNKNATEIDCHIRGLFPWPVAYTKIEGQNVKVFKATIITGVNGNSGEILDVSSNGIVVGASNDESICLEDIQLAGKRRMPLSDLLNGKHPFIVGATFDNN